MANFPPELQLELIEEDLNAASGVTVSPDEEQLEVLEDIWLKAGEIDLDDARIVDSGSKISDKKLKKRKKEDPEFSLTNIKKTKRPYKKRDKKVDDGEKYPAGLLASVDDVRKQKDNIEGK